MLCVSVAAKVNEYKLREGATIDLRVCESNNVGDVEDEGEDDDWDETMAKLEFVWIW